MGETQRLVWLLSMPACAQVNNAMQTLTGVNYQTSEQHKDLTKSRQQRDFKDLQTVTTYLNARSPFSADPSLRNIASGVVADDNVNADTAREIGLKILVSMIGKNALDFSFRHKDQTTTLATKSAVVLPGEVIQVDPQLLFQRLSVVATSGRYDDPQEQFKYEMCSYPPALFESSLLPKQANKPALADALWEKTKSQHTGLPSSPATATVGLPLYSGWRGTSPPNTMATGFYLWSYFAPLRRICLPAIQQSYHRLRRLPGRALHKRLYTSTTYESALPDSKL